MQMDAIANKNYGIGGADRDKDWTTGDKVLSFLQGMFNGDGAIPSAMDRNYREKLADKKEMKRLIPQVNQQQDAQNHDLGVQRTQAQIADIDTNNTLANRGLDLREYKIIAEEAYKREVIDLGKEKAEDNRRDRDRIYDLKKRGVDQNDARIKLLEEGIKSRERIAEQGNASREKIAGSQIASREGIARDTRNFNAEQKDAERKLRAALALYNKAADKDKAMALEQVRAAREAAKAAGIQ
jgi:hypothetical protein